jgi:hypothetical protein
LGKVFSLGVRDGTAYLTTGKPAQITAVNLHDLSVRQFAIQRRLAVVDDEVIERTKRRLIQVQVASQRETAARVLAGVDYPDSIPAFMRIFIDGAAHVWAERYRVDPGPTIFDVFDADGVWLGDVQAPQGIEVMQIGRDFIIARKRDTLGVDEIIVYPLRKGR